MQRKRLSYANVTATIALVAALGTGGAWAANSIHGDEIKDGTLRGKKLRDGTVPGRKITDTTIRNKDIASDTLRGNKIREGTLGKVPDAGDADTIDGVGLNGLALGNSRLITGRTVGSAGAGTDPNRIRTFQTPVGEFFLGCGAANVDTRYVNNNAGSAEAVRTVGEVGGPVVGEEADDTDRDLETQAQGDDIGYAATNATGPKWIELRVGKGARAAIFTAFANRDGTTCTWTWDLVQTK
jgi:hypothetical protein